MFWLFIFIGSALLLFWSGSRLVKALVRIARFLGWREFVVAFFVMAIAGSLPNLFIGVSSAFYKIPQLSFGDIVGGNIVDLTLAIALAILIGGASLPVRVKMIQTSVVFTVIIAVLPLILIFDGVLGKIDGLVLIFVFFIYLFWLFSRSERFKRVYNYNQTKNETTKTLKKTFKRFKTFLKNLIRVGFYLFLLLLASGGIVRSVKAFSSAFGISLPIIGILIIGIGNALPETYFAIVSVRKKQTAMILGDLIGSVIVCSTLVLGIVALIFPIEIYDFSPFAVARTFLIISALLFWFFTKTDRRISKKEAFILLLIFILFVLVESYL